MKGKLKLKEGTNWSAISGSGCEIDIDVPVSYGGTGKGPSPMELMLLGTGGCTAFDVMSILRKKKAEIEDFVVDLSAERAAEHPKVFTKIKVHFVIKGKNIKKNAVERAIELSENKYCSASAMLKKTADIEITYQIIDS
jgi:putative redox protein